MTSVEMSSASFQTSLVVVRGELEVLIVLHSLRRARDAAGQRACRGDRGRAEVDLRLRISHAPEEIAIGGGEGDFAVAERALMHAETAAASGIHDDGAGADEIGDHAALERFVVDAPRGG